MCSKDSPGHKEYQMPPHYIEKVYWQNSVRCSYNTIEELGPIGGTS